MTIKNLGKTVLFQCPITLQNQTKRVINVVISLTLLSRMKLPTFIKWTSPFSSSGLLGVVFHSYSNFNRTSCKQTLKSLITDQTLQSVASDIGLYYIPITDTTLELSVFWPSDTESRINELRFSESISLSFKTRLTSVICFCGDVTLSKLQVWNKRGQTC